MNLIIIKNVALFSEFKEKVAAAIQHSEQPVESQKVDCGCQSSIPIEQSCQCCECKDIGVTTSKDTETATEQTMTGEKLPKGVQKGDQSTSFHTSGDGPTLESKTTDGLDEAIASPAIRKSHGEYKYCVKKLGNLIMKPF